MTSAHCCAGNLHEGTPKGSETTLHGLPSYVAEPPSGSSPSGIIVILPDGFGWTYVSLPFSFYCLICCLLCCDSFPEEESSIEKHLLQGNAKTESGIADLDIINSFKNIRILADIYAERVGARCFLPEFMDGKSCVIAARRIHSAKIRPCLSALCVSDK